MATISWGLPGTVPWDLPVLSHLIFPTQQPQAVGTLLTPLLLMRKQRPRVFVELAQGHTAYEWVDPSNSIPDSKLLLLSMLSCSTKLGFRKVKECVKEHRSGRYRPRPRTHLLTWDYTWGMWQSWPSLSWRASILSPRMSPRPWESLPLHLVISCQHFPMLCPHLLHGYHCPSGGGTLHLPTPIQSPVPKRICCLLQSRQTDYHTVWAANNQGNPPNPLNATVTSTSWNQTFQTNRSRSPRQILPIPLADKIYSIGCNASLPDVLT